MTCRPSFLSILPRAPMHPTYIRRSQWTLPSLRSRSGNTNVPVLSDASLLPSLHRHPCSTRHRRSASSRLPSFHHFQGNTIYYLPFSSLLPYIRFHRNNTRFRGSGTTGRSRSGHSRPHTSFRPRNSSSCPPCHPGHPGSGRRKRYTRCSCGTSHRSLSFPPRGSRNSSFPLFPYTRRGPCWFPSHR